MHRRKFLTAFVPGLAVATLADKGSALVTGYEFMRAVWSIWFGVSDQPTLADQLISALP